MKSLKENKVEKISLKDVLVEKIPDKYAIVISLICGGNKGRTEICSHFVKKAEGTFFDDGKNEKNESYFEYRKRVAWGNVQPKDIAYCIEFETKSERMNFF